MVTNNKKLIPVATILIVLGLTAISFFVYFEYLDKENEITAEEPKDREIDNRISPLENQGLILEINRIRHRGLVDKILKPGFNWRYKPIFYFVCKMDDLEFSSRDVVSAGLRDDEPFNTWDTMFMENKIMIDVEEEQKTSEITITLKEQEKKGLFGLRSQDVEKDKIHVTYDYRTGRWTGDDEFGDNDGYGHYVGKTFEVWFNVYQTDFDHDGIPYWTEINLLGTNPRIDDAELDPDNDGIPTPWEWRWAYDPYTWNDHMYLDPDIDGIENIEEYKMRKWFADPFSQDIYIEVDGMERGGLFDPPHVLWEESQQIIIERFAQHGFNVYIDFGWPNGPSNGGGELLYHHKAISPYIGTFLQYYNNHFSDERKGIFRYFIIAHSSGYSTASKFNRIDCSSIGTARKNMWKPAWHAYTPRLQRLYQASGIMHEIGHTLGILPWTFEGCDNFSYAYGLNEKKQYQETWGDYYSSMNYFYIFDYKLVDYSDGSNGAPYDQNDWEELYLPTFQIECINVEDPTFKTPGTDQIIIEKIEFKIDRWDYNEDLTQQYINNNSGRSPIEPVKCDWRVYVEQDNKSSIEKNLRIYAQPIYKNTIIMDSGWTLIYEAYLDNEGNIQNK